MGIGLTTDSIRRLGTSHFNYWFGYVANIALVVWMASRAAPEGRLLLGPAATLGCIAAGLCAWTLCEYLLHRFVYHRIPSFLQVGHSLHHARPKVLIGIPWYVSSVIVVLTFSSLWAIWPHASLAVACSATWSGYIVYCILHHATHHFGLRHGYLRRMKRHHLVHHAHPDYNWGFTTAFWDVVFGTHKAIEPSKRAPRTPCTPHHQ